MSSEKNWLHTASLKQVRSSNEVCIWYQLLGTSGSILHPDAHSIGLSHLQVVKNGRLPEIEICEVATTSFQEKRGRCLKTSPPSHCYGNVMRIPIRAPHVYKSCMNTYLLDFLTSERLWYAMRSFWATLAAYGTVFRELRLHYYFKFQQQRLRKLVPFSHLNLT